MIPGLVARRKSTTAPRVVEITGIFGDLGTLGRFDRNIVVHQGDGIVVHGTVDADERRIFGITMDIFKRCFPFLLDLDNPALFKGFSRLDRINRRIARAGGTGAAFGAPGRAFWGAAAGFVRPLLPTKPDRIPETSRLRPAW